MNSGLRVDIVVGNDMHCETHGKQHIVEIPTPTYLLWMLCYLDLPSNPFNLVLIFP